jgi:hypothetical protein
MAAAGDGLSSADRLCVACVELFGVDGAALSLVDHGATRGTFGSSGALSRHIDELQFTCGEGPCMDAVTGRGPVLVDDLDAVDEQRWPAFAEKALAVGMRAVFAFPVSIASVPIGALDLFRGEPGSLRGDDLMGGMWAADLAALPVLDVLAASGGAQHLTRGDGWEHLTLLDRMEVHQASGMVSVQLGVGVPEALARLRAYAFAHDRTASDVAWDIVERRLTLNPDDVAGPPNGGMGSTS